MAMTCWPAVMVFESPMVAAGRSETLEIFRKATSLRGSVATTVTESFVVPSARMTLILLAPEMTCLLVRT